MQDPRPRNIAFNWDQTHTLNLSAIYAVPNDFSISAILRFGSGQPYTPEMGTGFGADFGTKLWKKRQLLLT